MNVGFVGMTHLGQISALVAQRKGFGVVAVDDHPHAIPTISEPGFTEVRCSGNFAELMSCDLIFITHDVDTIHDISRVYHLFRTAYARSNCPIVIMSQVPIGTTRRFAEEDTLSAPVFYQLDTLRMGHAIERAMNPEMITVGCSVNVGNVPAVYREYLDAFRAPINFCLYEEAEIAKSMINIYLAAQVAATNVGAAVCEKHKVSWRAIVPTLAADARIGRKAYLQPGKGFEGSHLVRDVVRIGNETDFDPFIEGLMRSRLGAK